MKNLILKNDFHLTQVTLRVSCEDEIKAGTNFKLSPSQVKRAFYVLCGSKDCCCGGVAGERSGWHKLGNQEVQLDILEEKRNYYNDPVGATVVITKVAFDNF